MRKLVVCKVKPEQLDALYDGELRGWRARMLQAHVEVCERCRDYLNGLRRVSDALGNVEQIEPSADFTARVAMAVRQRESVLAPVADKLKAPDDVGGPAMVEAVMAQVRRMPRHTPVGERSAKWVELVPRLGLSAALAAIAVAAALVAVRTPAVRQAVSVADVQIARLLHRVTPAPLATARVAAERLAALRQRQAAMAGVRLEDTGFSIAPEPAGEEQMASGLAEPAGESGQSPGDEPRAAPLEQPLVGATPQTTAPIAPSQ